MYTYLLVQDLLEFRNPLGLSKQFHLNVIDQKTTVLLTS